ncbi:helix-turn-helix transcriptional regulator [uncultured Thiohalocapsa sp.]|uniref:helix-turn-helix domain-containing protein n=1 Tax=uncultured Thiohalocapsa sp. TaxID=768990 RepID=UPI0025FDEC41|nr:helix-turn-helix transcriptional regulator [uncultured Thiohalocapsa sp.]
MGAAPADARRDDAAQESTEPPAHSGGTPSRWAQVELAREIGRRLRNARELAGFQQQEAAGLLGYVQKGNLSRIESHLDGRSAVPLWLLPRAARLYGVSADYLLGIVDDPEADALGAAERAVVGIMGAVWDEQRRRDVHAMTAALARIAELEADCAALTRLTSGAASALQRFVALNPGWPDMPGGASLALKVQQSASTAARLCSRLAKLHEDGRRVADGPVTDHDPEDG